MKRRILPFIVAAIVLPSAHAADQAAAKDKAGADAAAGLPRQALTPQFLYQFLLAEIAGTRGHVGLSADVYLDLARKSRDPRVARRAAEIAFFARRYDAALEVAKLWAELDPEAAQARQMVIGLLAATNRSQELADHLATQLSAAGADIRALLLGLRRVLARHPDKPAALGLVLKVTEPYLDLAEAHFARAQAAHEARDPALAIRELDQALALRPDWEDAALGRAQLTGSAAEAVEFLGRFVAANPAAQDARLAHARGLVGEKRYDQARQQFQRLLADSRDNGDVVYAVAVLSLQLDDIDEAERQFRRLVETGHGEINNARLYLGQIAEERKRPKEALDWYGQVTAGGQYLSARMRMAHLLARQDRLAEARQALQASAVANAAERGQLLVAEAQLLRDAARFGEAFDLLAAGLENHPDHPELLYETALMAEKIGKMDLVERHLRRLIELRPDHAHAHNALGYSLADRNERLEEAQQLIDKALELAPGDPFILDSKGWILFRRGDAAGAVDILRKAYSLRADPEIAAHLGEALWVLGRQDEARKTWSEAMKANPANEVLVGTVKKFAP